MISPPSNGWHSSQTHSECVHNIYCLHVTNYLDHEGSTANRQARQNRQTDMVKGQPLTGRVDVETQARVLAYLTCALGTAEVQSVVKYLQPHATNGGNASSEFAKLVHALDPEFYENPADRLILVRAGDVSSGAGNSHGSSQSEAQAGTASPQMSDLQNGAACACACENDDDITRNPGFFSQAQKRPGFLVLESRT